MYLASSIYQFYSPIKSHGHMRQRIKKHYNISCKLLKMLSSMRVVLYYMDDDLKLERNYMDDHDH